MLIDTVTFSELRRPWPRRREAKSENDRAVDPGFRKGSIRATIVVN
jgi:hypothetical protein